MGSISVACYKPRPGREAALLELVRNHLPLLRTEGLVTERAPIVMSAVRTAPLWKFSNGFRKKSLRLPTKTPWYSTCGNSSKPYAGTRLRPTSRSSRICSATSSRCDEPL